MIGNSSSGIIEAPIFKIPVINVGDRQKGRLRNKNIIDTDYTYDSIYNGIYIALNDKDFIDDLANIENIYGDGTTSSRIIKVIKSIELNRNLLSKKLTY